MSPHEITTILWRLDQQDEVLGEIKAHAEKTNGRVTKLELWQARWEGARSAMGWIQPLLIALVAGGGVAVVEHFLK